MKTGRNETYGYERELTGIKENFGNGKYGHLNKNGPDGTNSRLDSGREI